MAESLRQMWDKMWSVVVDQAAAVLPKVAVGAFILLVGLLIARLVRGVAARFFLAIRLDRVSDRLGVGAFLARGDVRHTVAEILATAIYWLVLLFSLQALGLTLGLDGMAAFFGKILGYLPRLVVALVIIAAGIAVATFFGSAVQLAASNAGFPAARPLSAAVKYLMGFFAIVMALEHLQIATALLVTTLEIVITAVALALALAYGLGCKDLARDSVKGWLARTGGAPGREAPKPDESPAAAGAPASASPDVGL
jgi:hypothetical protein